MRLVKGNGFFAASLKINYRGNNKRIVCQESYCLEHDGRRERWTNSMIAKIIINQKYYRTKITFFLNFIITCFTSRTVYPSFNTRHGRNDTAMRIHMRKKYR